MYLLLGKDHGACGGLRSPRSAATCALSGFSVAEKIKEYLKVARPRLFETHELIS